MSELLFFVAYSVALGAALAMDAFSVSVSDAIRNPSMKKSRMCAIALVYAFFQFLMPMIGYVCVEFICSIFTVFQRFVPWIALVLLLYLGGKMIFEAISKKDDDEKSEYVQKKRTIFVQGIATSIDALSVGFTLSSFSALKAFCASVIIALVTFLICFSGLLLGKKVGERLSGRAEIVGGAILVIIGLEIFLKNIKFFAC